MRVYATTDDGRRFLREIKCEKCEHTIMPNPEISKSGWTLHGTRYADGSVTILDYCPDHSHG